MSPALAVLGTGKFGWGSLLSSGDLDFITSAAVSGAASISVNNCFSAGYDHYLIMRSMSGSAGANLSMRLRVGGTDATGTDYRRQRVYATSTTVGGDRDTGSTSFVSLAGYTESTACGFTQVWVSNPFAAVRTTVFATWGYDHTASILLQSAVAEHDLTTSYDGFTLTPDSGNLTGTVYVYGLAV